MKRRFHSAMPRLKDPSLSGYPVFSANGIRLRALFLLGALLCMSGLQAQVGNLSGRVSDEADAGIPGASVLIDGTSFSTYTDFSGGYRIEGLPYGQYTLAVHATGMVSKELELTIAQELTIADIKLEPFELDLKQVDIQDRKARTDGLARMRSIQNFGVYAGKKNEVILPRELTINAATNNARQLYAKITGLHIWESDQAGLQLGIGGRGLNPNRTSNFNVRQNGYDISADALGYPESYYTPPAEALERIEILRGAASLQYGTQFGGMVNFKFREGATDRKLSIVTRQSVGSWGFFNSFNSVGGTVADGRVNYYGYYQFKRGDGYRQNSGFDYQNAYASAAFKATEKLTVKLDLTKMAYEAQQAGGLTDRLFNDDPRQSARSRNWFSVDWNLAALEFTYKLNPSTELNLRNFGLFAERQSVGNLERINRFDEGGNRTLISGDFENLGSEFRLIKRYGIGESLSALLAGARIYNGRSNSRQGDGSDGNDANFNFLNPNDVEGSDYDFNNVNVALFAENVFYISPRFTITPGIRAEYIATYADGFYKQRVLDAAGNVIVENKIKESDSRKRNFLLGGVGLSYKPNDKLEWYGNFSQNYRAINFTDLRVVNPNFRVDPNIQDERGFTADAGLRGNVNQLFNYELTGFLLSYRDKIGQILRTDEPPLFLDYRYRSNISDARIYGLEAFGELRISSLLRWKEKYRLSWFINTSLVNARYVNSDDSAIEGNEVEMAPPFLLRSGINFKINDLSLMFQGSHTSDHYSDASNAELSSTAVEGLIYAYQILDFSAAYTIKRFTLEANVNNLLDQAYFTRRAESYPGPGIIPSDGRGFYFTLQYKW